ncbi:hypothetical protein AAK894_08055 [Lachnospiraceae bacterium 46-61]
MYNKNKNSCISQMTEEERREESKKIQIEIEKLQQKELNENDMRRLMSLIKKLKDVEEPPEFDVEAGWKDFTENYMPKVEKYIVDREIEKARKYMYRRLFIKKVTDFAIMVGFTVIFTVIAIGRSGFVNYNYFNSKEMNIISSKSMERIQQDIEDEYMSLERESGTKVAKLNLDTSKYALQRCGSSKKYISIEYLNKHTQEGVIFFVFNHKPNNGEFNIEKDDIVETYMFQDIEYDIIKNQKRYDVSWNKDSIYYVLQNCDNIKECKKIIESISY